MPLINKPFFAPTPVPTMRAVGVARPRAQGQAITKVESNSVPLPTDPNYVDASLEVDMEIIEEEMENPNTFDLVD